MKTLQVKFRHLAIVMPILVILFAIISYIGLETPLGSHMNLREFSDKQAACEKKCLDHYDCKSEQQQYINAVKEERDCKASNDRSQYCASLPEAARKELCTDDESLATLPLFDCRGLLKNISRQGSLLKRCRKNQPQAAKTAVEECQQSVEDCKNEIKAIGIAQANTKKTIRQSQKWIICVASLLLLVMGILLLVKRTYRVWAVCLVFLGSLYWQWQLFGLFIDILFPGGLIAH